MTTFQDILKEGFLQNAETISAASIGGTLILAFITGMFIFYIYRKTYQSVVYTKSFNISLVMMTMVTALVILAVTSNVVLSLGMVGALSIVRFRSAIKDPMDIVFMFWSIASGIILGAGFYTLALIGSLVLGVIIIVLTKNITQENPYILLINHRCHEEKEIINRIKASTEKYYMRSKVIQGNNTELTVEIRIKKDEGKLVNELNSIKGVESATMVSCNEFSS